MSHGLKWPTTATCGKELTWKLLQYNIKDLRGFFFLKKALNILDSLDCHFYTKLLIQRFNFFFHIKYIFLKCSLYISGFWSGELLRGGWGSADFSWVRRARPRTLALTAPMGSRPSDQLTNKRLLLRGASSEGSHFCKVTHWPHDPWLLSALGEGRLSPGHNSKS